MCLLMRSLPFCEHVCRRERHPLFGKPSHVFPLLQAQLTQRQGDPPLGSITATVRAASKLLAAAPLSAPHLHIFGICYERHNATRHVGAPWVSRWRDAGASYTDVPKEQNAYPI